MTRSEVTLAELEAIFPRIAWRKPVLIKRPDGAEGYACRICVAQRGFKGQDVDKLPKTELEVLRHIAEVHPRAA